MTRPEGAADRVAQAGAADESQRSLVAARLATMNRGRPSENASIEAITQSQAAELLNVSRPCMQRAKSVKLQAERKLGEMLKATPKNTGAKGIGPIAVPDENRNQPPTLADLGIDKKVSQ